MDNKYNAKESTYIFKFIDTLTTGTDIDLVLSAPKRFDAVMGTSRNLYGAKEENFFVESIGLFSNFADGLIIKDSSISFGICSANVYNLNYSLVSDLNINYIQLPAMNAMFEVNRFIQRTPEISGGLTGDNIVNQIPYMTSLYQAFGTSLIDSSLDGSDVWFEMRMKVIHSFDLQFDLGV